MGSPVKNLPIAIISFLLLLFFTASFAIRTDFSFDQDLGRHLKLGEIITAIGQVPKSNLFSYTNPDFPFINHHFLFEVILFSAKQSIGMEGILLIKVLLILLSVGLVTSLVTKSKYPLMLPLGYIFLHALRSRVELRPEILSFFYTALIYFILTKFEEKKTGWIFTLPVVQLLWVNTHIYFPMGFILQGIFIIHFFIRKEAKRFKLLLGIFLVSALLSLLNPNTLEGLLYPLQIFGNYGYTIAENQNLFLLESLNFKDPDFLFVKIAVFLSFLSLIVSFIRHTFTLKNLLLTLLGVTLALVHVRSFPYLVFLSLPAVVANFGEIKKTRAVFIVAVITAVLLIYESIFYLNGDYYKYLDKNTQFGIGYKSQAEKALNFVLGNQLPQPIFNNFDIGSYIIYRGSPELKVFVDGRPEAYPADFFQGVYIPMQQTPQNFSEVDQKIGFQTIIFSHTDQTPWAKAFISFITRNESWKTVYLDDFMIVLVKNDVARQKNLQVIDFDKLSPEKYSFDNHLSYLRTGLFLLSTEYYLPSKLFAQKSLDIFPDSPVGNLMMANLQPRTSNIFELQQTQIYLQKSKRTFWW